MSNDNVNVIFEERFEVNDVDKDGKKFDRVSRITGRSESLGMELTLDYANELIQFAPKDKFHLMLSRTLSEDPDAVEGMKDAENKREMWRGGDQGLAENFDYVMYGKIYKFDDSSRGENSTTAYISFGGLLMALRGNYRHMQHIVIGENVFLLIRK